MLSKAIQPTALTAVALVLVVSSASAATPAEDAFRAGVADSRAGDHASALTHFRTARARGLETGALYYNLGATYYALGRLDDAEREFRQAAESDAMAAPALYRLGRIARERGDTGLANDYFREAADRAKTDRLRRAALAELPRTWSDVSAPDFLYVLGGAGYDSNVALTPDDASGLSEESDIFAEAFAVGRLPVSDRDYLRGSVYAQEFLDESDSNVLALRGGIGRVGTLGGDWLWDTYVDARHLRFGDEAFENSLFAGGELTRRLGKRWWLDLGYEFELTRGVNDFDFVDGTTHAFEAVLDQSGLTGWELGAELETTDAEDRDTGDDFFSFSRDRITLTAEYALALNQRDRVVLEGDWRHSRYEGDEVRNGVSLGEREDDRYGVELGFKRRFGEHWRASVSARLEQRNSNLDEFDYDREVFRADISRRF